MAAVVAISRCVDKIPCLAIESHTEKDNEFIWRRSVSFSDCALTFRALLFRKLE
jgi:hypothetical protein